MRACRHPIRHRLTLRDQIPPQLRQLLAAPTVGPLIERNLELLLALDKIEKAHLMRAHVFSPPDWPAPGARAVRAPERSRLAPLQTAATRYSHYCSIKLRMITCANYRTGSIAFLVISGSVGQRSKSGVSGVGFTALNSGFRLLTFE